MNSMLRWTASALLTSSAVACGAGDGQPDPGSRETGEAPSASSPDVDAEFAKVTQSLGEATCATTAADHVMDPTLESYVDSPTATYDHTTCRNGYVVDLKNATAGHEVSASVHFQPSDPFSCLFVWSYVGLYQKQGASYVKVGENTGRGAWGWGAFGGACSAIGKITTPVAGDYKVVASAGNLFGGRYAVRVLYLQ
jgi:hypothetical protein